MKKILLFTIIFWAFISIAVADNDMGGASIRCSYKYTYVFDSLKNETHEDLMIGQYGKDRSVFFSNYTYEVDSLSQTPDYHLKFRQAFLAAVEKDGSESNGFPHRRTSSYIYKDYQQATITIYDDIACQSFYCYTDTLDAQKWEISEDSTKTILGYECQQAMADYHGRKWIAWFTYDIPISNGPWKLGGLPGLIMEAHDANKEHCFEINGMEQCDIPILDITKSHKYKKTERKKFLKAERKSLENILLSLPNSEATQQVANDLGLDNANVLRRDLLETDYR